jgi:ATP/maltotriose-dependent transcriptional regulator MalT
VAQGLIQRRHRCAQIAAEQGHTGRTRQSPLLTESFLSSQGLSHGEISAQLAMPLGTVKAHARRGLLSIRAALLGVDHQGDVQ